MQTCDITSRHHLQGQNSTKIASLEPLQLPKEWGGWPLRVVAIAPNPWLSKETSVASWHLRGTGVSMDRICIRCTWVGKKRQYLNASSVK